jgi:Family of unknown function (DUF5906)/Primase C terminal 2 (PriCT-2)
MNLSKTAVQAPIAALQSRFSEPPRPDTIAKLGDALAQLPLSVTYAPDKFGVTFPLTGTFGIIFEDLLSSHQEQPDKDAHGLVWSALTIDRKGANVDNVQAFVFDIDGGLSLPDINDALVSLKASAISYSTYSHGGTKGVRVRVVIPLAEPMVIGRDKAAGNVSEGLYKALYKNLGDELFGAGSYDASGSSLGRIMWLPSKPIGSSVAHFTNVYQGGVYDVTGSDRAAVFVELHRADDERHATWIAQAAEREAKRQARFLAGGDDVPKLKEINDLLAKCDANALGYHARMSVIIAVANETESSDEGRDLVLEWNRGSAFHRDAEFDSIWNSVSPDSDNPITIGTLYHHAGVSRGEATAVAATAGLARLAEKLPSLNDNTPKVVAPSVVEPLKDNGPPEKLPLDPWLGDYRTGDRLILSKVRGKSKFYRKARAEAERQFDKMWHPITLGGKFLFLRTDGSEKPDIVTHETLCSKYLNWSTDVSRATPEDDEPKPQWQRFTQAWVTKNHCDTSYGFYPQPPGHRDACPENAINSYHGFAVKPVKGDWSIMKGHIYRNLCSRNALHFRWFMAWLAQKVQQPHIKLGTAVVLTGLEGVGKSVLGEALTKLFGRHGQKVGQNEMTGQFNDHFEQMLFALVEETGFAGDPDFESMLKDLVTCSTLMYNRKNVAIWSAPNYTSFMLCTNRAWAVGAGTGGRRWFLPKVGSERKGDKAYFKALCDQLYNDGGLEAMLYDLLRHDFSGVDLRNPPVTEGLVEQRIFSLDKQLRIVRARLIDGGITDPRNGGFHAFNWDSPTDVPRKADFAACEDHIGSKTRKALATDWGLYLGKTIPGLESPPNKQGTRNDRDRVYRYPSYKSMLTWWKATQGEEIVAMAVDDGAETDLEKAQRERADLQTQLTQKIYELDALKTKVLAKMRETGEDWFPVGQNFYQNL